MAHRTQSFGFNNSRRNRFVSLLCIVCGLFVRSLSGAEDWSPSNFSRIDWQPTRAVRGARYLDTKTCAGCHPKEAATHFSSAMGLALERAEDCQILRSLPRLQFRSGGFDYTIERNEGHERRRGRRDLTVESRPARRGRSRRIARISRPS